MADKDTNPGGTPIRDAYPTGLAEASPMITSDLVIETAPSFAIASLMINSAQAQARAMEAGVDHLNQAYIVGLATTTQAVTRVFEQPSQTQVLLNSLIAANKL